MSFSVKSQETLSNNLAGVTLRQIQSFNRVFSVKVNVVEPTNTIEEWINGVPVSLLKMIKDRGLQYPLF
jgi:hypothetical protein